MPSTKPLIAVRLTPASHTAVRKHARSKGLKMAQYVEDLIAADFATRGEPFERTPTHGNINRIPSRREKMVVVSFDAFAREFDIREVTEPPTSYTQAIRNEEMKLTAYLRGFPWTEAMMHDLKLELMGFLD